MSMVLGSWKISLCRLQLSCKQNILGSKSVVWVSDNREETAACPVILGRQRRDAKASTTQKAFM